MKFVNQTTTEPFPSLLQRRKEAEHLLKRVKEGKVTAEEEAKIRFYDDYTRKCARFARIQLEEDVIKERLGGSDIDIDVALVSARQYSLWKAWDEDGESPKMSPEATGIPALRRYLLQLPAHSNYETLKSHVFHTLPSITKNIDRILTKFDEDVNFARMRKYLKEQSSVLPEILYNLAFHESHSHVVRPWDNILEDKPIKKGLEKFVAKLQHGLVYYATFIKMLKENGIPVNGKGFGRNLNKEIMHAFQPLIEKWEVTMAPKVHGMATRLFEPIQSTLRRLEEYLGEEGIHPELRARASDALNNAIARGQDAFRNLETALEAGLRDTLLLYTTEVNIKCPFAIKLKPIYHSALAKVGGTGAYNRARGQLERRLVGGARKSDHLPLPEIMAIEIVSTQSNVWWKCCDEFVDEVMEQLENFQRITDELLHSQGFIKAEHRQLRDQLRPLLPEFERNLALIQAKFPNIEVTGTKRKRDDEGAT